MIGRCAGSGGGTLFGISDLHIGHPENRRVVEELHPSSAVDWLVVCGDISDTIDDVDWALRLLSGRFARVIWTPGNHELWTSADEPCQLRGEHRYRHLVELCRRYDVHTPEDPYPVWEGAGGPVTIAPLFLLYDYSFGRSIAPTEEQALAKAYESGTVCSDEFLLHSDPYPTRAAWCHARVEATEARLDACEHGIPKVLVTHLPLLEELTWWLARPEFAQWCGTHRTEDWHRRFRAALVVYGHLHIPRTSWHDGVRFEEVSLGFPRERHQRSRTRGVLRNLLPWGVA